MSDNQDTNRPSQTAGAGGDGVTGDSPQVKSHFIKSNYFRVIHADGAWGGVTPQLNVQMAIYNERIPIPQQLVEQVLPNATLSPMADQTVAKEGIVREVEVEVIMNLEVAKSLRVWLDDKIQQVEKIQLLLQLQSLQQNQPKTENQ